MNFDFAVFLDGFYKEEINNKRLWDEIREYPDHDFFLDLNKHLTENFYPNLVNEIYVKISVSYFRAKKYFEEH